MSVSDEEVKKVADRAASSKGMPWGESEFWASIYMIKYDLRKRGATDAQLQELDRLVEAAPVRGGGFNSYSGD